MAEPIAIVGMAAMFPKSPDLKGFWHLIRAGVDGISDIPETHWSPDDYFHADQKSPDMTYCRRGGFLPAHRFDPTEFSLPPTVLEATDTSQLLGLVVAKAALEDAGYGAQREFKRDSTSIILGVTGTLELVVPLGARLGHPVWRKALQESGLAPNLVDEVMARISDGFVGWQENSFPGLLGNVVAGRIANRLDLHGTNCVVDAACASSLSAAHLAMMELQTGKADMVITGGADTFNDIFMYMCFSKTPALSPSGKIRPFSEESDGTLIGEGLGMVVLKRLADAKADGDRIYAVIKGLGTASDGNSGAVYAPDSKGQARALRNAYESAGVDPSTVRLVEAHGTGTKVGDVVEFEGLRSVYAPASEDKQYIALGSIKSQIGHTKAAAGSASLIKAALALYYKVFPPTLGVVKPNPKLNIEESPFYISRESRPWVSDPRFPRRVALSSFGFGGSNFHMLLEEADPQRAEVAWDGSVRLWAQSAATAAELTQKLRLAATSLSAEESEQARAAFASCQSFDAKARFRCILVWQTERSLKELLTQAADAVQAGKAVQGPEVFFVPEADAGKLVFMFPGQGSQYVNMGRDWACLFPELLESIERMDRFAPAGQPLSAKLYPNSTYSDEVKQEREAALTATNCAQPALGAVNRGLFEVLSQRFGLQPDFTCGHSYGELCALYAAGVYDVDALCKLSFLRGELMAAGDGGRGAMVAVTAPLEKVEALLPELGPDVTIANRNSPTQCVLSGTKEAIQAATAKLKANGLRGIPLQVGAAFHSPLVASAEEPFRKGLEEVKFGKSSIPVVANKTAKDYPAEAKKARDLLANQLVSQVNWVAQVEELYARGARTFIEVGPKTVLTKLVGAILKGKDHQVLALDASQSKNSLLDMAQALAQLAALGFAARLGAWETSPAAARARKMTVELTGANYRSSYNKSLPPARPQGSVDVVPPAQAARPQAAAPAPMPVSQPPAPVVKQVVQQVVQPPAAAQEAFHQVQSSLLAIQALQQQAATTHQKFLEGQQTAMKTFQSLVEGQQALMQRLSSGSSPQPLSSLPTPAVVAPQPTPKPMPVAPRPVVAQPAPAPAPAPSPVPTAAPAPAAAAAAPVASSAPVAQAVLAVVADKTGYPAEMLTLEMDLEGDLGIDSIKRVEILAAVQERLPHLSSPPSDQMGSLRTLAEVVASLGGSSSQPAPVVAAPPASATAPVAGALLEVVAEKTGYPVEMLTLEMDLEADLGIDSIKRVEILAAIEEKVPGLPKVAPDQMGALRTLGEIVAAFGSGAAPTIAAPVVATGAPVAGALLEVVAEKTGYPMEMLTLEMDLEGDLGIDSIKRVEILAAIEEKVPGLPKVAPDQMGALRTLGEIVAAFGASTAVAQAAPPAASSSAPVAAALLEVVAEKTGYPLEMLNLEMDLEGDLGVDSIKRVEILAALEEKVPDMPKVAPDQMGALRTLGQIVEALGGSSAPTKSAPATSGADSSHLLQVVAEKTGYPVEMLTLEMDLEADLGVDSIKRVEILASIPEASKIPSDQVGSLRTLRQILEALGAGPVSTPAAPVVKPPVVVAGTQRLERRVLLATALAPLANGGNWPLAAGAKVMLYPSNTSLAKALSKDLQAKGAQVVESVSEDLAGLFLVGDGIDSLEGLKKAFQLVREAAPALRRQRGHLVSLARLDGRFGLTGNFAKPESGALTGLPKTAAHEWPEVTCRAFDIDSQWRDDKAVSQKLIQELSYPGPLEVGLTANQRFGLGTPLEELCGDEPLFLPKDLVLVTGGARGVTAATVIALAKACQPTLVLLGRSPLPAQEPAWAHGLEEGALKKALLQNEFGGKASPKDIETRYKALLAQREVHQTLDAIRAAGAQVEYRSLDVRDQKAVEAMLQEVQKSFGPVQGLIHGAGVLADKRIEEKTDEMFDSVFATKVVGLTNLLTPLRDVALKGIVLFSSVTARFGRPGQVDYCMANDLLNKTAALEAKRRPQCRVVSLNWGPWGGGMVTEGLKKEFQRLGVGLIELEAGANALVRELSTPPGGAVEILYGDGFPAPPGNGEVVSSNQAALLKVSVSVDEFPCLDSHQVGGRPVVPVALQIEWFAQAAMQQTLGSRFRGLRQLQILRPIALEGQGSILLQVVSAGDQLELQNAQTGQVYTRASVDLGSELPVAPTLAAVNGLANQAFPHNDSDIYQEHLFHGPHFHAVKNVQGWSSSGLVAQVGTLAKVSDWVKQPQRSDWLADPLAVDAALQLGILWGIQALGKPSLPMVVGGYQQFQRKFPKGGVEARLWVERSSPSKIVASVDFVDAQGQLVARLSNVEWTADASLKQAFMKEPASSPR